MREQEQAQAAFDMGALVARLTRENEAMRKALLNVRKIISDGALTGFNWKDGDWADRLFTSQHVTSSALRSLKDSEDAKA